MPSDPKLKRKAQNRAAQRAFRERKEQFVNELQEQMRQLRQAKEKREKELSAENARLKKENEKLKEENHLLKDAHFTLNLSPSSKDTKTDKPTPTPLVASPNTESQTMLSFSPEMHDHLSQTDKSIFSYCCRDDDLSDYQGGSTSDSARTLPEANFAKELELALDNNAAASLDYLFNNSNSSIINDNKESLLFNDYRVPSSEVDFLIHGEPLPALFGSEMELFGATGSDPTNTCQELLDALFGEQMQTLAEQDALLQVGSKDEKPCKKKILGMLHRARGSNRSISQINQDVMSCCPDINLDQLCQDLKQKITFEPHRTLTDDDVDLYIKCIQQHV